MKEEAEVNGILKAAETLEQRITDLKNARDSIDFASWVFHTIEKECGSATMDIFSEHDIGKFTRVPMKDKRTVMKQLMTKKIKRLEYNRRFFVVVK